MDAPAGRSWERGSDPQDDGVTGTAGPTAWGSGSGGGGSASELVTVATGGTCIGVAQGWVSIMCVPPGSGP